MLNFLELVLDYLFVTIVVHLISLLNISDGELKLYKPAKLSTQLYVKKGLLLEAFQVRARWGPPLVKVGKSAVSQNIYQPINTWIPLKQKWIDS